MHLLVNQQPVTMHNNFQNNTTSNIAILIVARELSFAIELEMLIRKIGYSLISRVDNFSKALEIMLAEAPDVAIMDIEFTESLAYLKSEEILKQLGIPICFLRNTVHSDQYPNLRNKPYSTGYLLKPINQYEILRVIDLVILSKQYKANSNQHYHANTFVNKEFLYFKRRTIYHKIAIADIFYIKAAGDYLGISTKHNNKYTVAIRLAIMEQILASHGFIKIHRSYLANLKNATSVDMDNHTISFGGVRIPFSRRRKGVVLGRVQVV